MPIKPVSREEAVITLHAVPDPIPVRGNAMASGDERLDHEAEDAILARLEQGEVWAWAAVSVSVSWEGLSAHSSLGCCSYEDEEDFRQPGGYFDDMVEEALEALNAALQRLHQALASRSAHV